ncbi:hypothetical protein FHP08_02910 [Zeimonas arvi]|uniref:Cation-transporting P-type ATPase C-terminal domain-containing protein n=1 Tax=Zeimonas arvi TaxID=2498847 RepID=A0A5C8P661_9BURK|nr:hypothetical protein FHP08_02910 [Zeimonas arvi]
MLASIAACAVLQRLHTHTPVMHAIFGSARLSPGEWLRAIGAGLLVFVVEEIEKAVIRRMGVATGRRIGLLADGGPR